MKKEKFAGFACPMDGTGCKPLDKQQARDLLRATEKAQAARERAMPDQHSAIQALFDAYIRLHDFGWREAIYCPKDGSIFDAIEMLEKAKS